MYPDLYTPAEVFTPPVPPGSTRAAATAAFHTHFSTDAAAVTQRYILLHYTHAGIVPVMLHLAIDSTPATAVVTLRFLHAAVQYGTTDDLLPCRELEALINDLPLLDSCVQQLTQGPNRCKDWNYWFARLVWQLTPNERVTVHRNSDLFNGLLALLERTLATGRLVYAKPDDVDLPLYAAALLPLSGGNW